MRNIYPHTFPLPSENFPYISGTTLLGKAINETSIISQAPVPMIYLTALSVESVALQGLVNVEMPLGKVCPASLNTLIIADSGERKSTIESMLTEGIKQYHKNSTKHHQNELVEYKIKQEVFESEIIKIKKEGGLK